MSIILKNFIECDDKLVYEIICWRNHNNIRLNSLNRNIITIEEHREFIASLEHDKSRLYFVVENNNVNIGVISFTNINKESAYIGYYKNPYLNINGIGQILINTAKKYAKECLVLKELFMVSYVDNIISQHCITKQGFEMININNNIIKYRLRLT